MHLPGQSLGGFFGLDADGFAALYIDERGSNFPPIAELQSPFSETAAGDHRDCVGDAAVDLYKSDQPFAIFAPRIVDAKFMQTKHGETYAQDLPCTEMPMRLFSIAKIFIEGFHKEESAFGGQRSA